MSAEPDALAVVNQLRDLAADPMNRRAIVQDQGCLPGLILFLDHPNPQVVYSALLVSAALTHRSMFVSCQQRFDGVRGGLAAVTSGCSVQFQLSRFWCSRGEFDKRTTSFYVRWHH